ncbi:hypothetical protein VaNZ11_005229, partial [Volvox africanus]
IEDAVPAGPIAAVRDSDGGGEEPRGASTDNDIATGTTAATRTQLPETKADGSMAATTTVTTATATASPLYPSVVVDGAADVVGNLAGSDREVVSPSAPGGGEAAGDLSVEAGLRQVVRLEKLRVEELDAAAGEAATAAAEMAAAAAAVPNVKLVTADGGGGGAGDEGDDGGGDGNGGRGEAGSSAAVAAAQPMDDTAVGERRGMSAPREGHVAAALMHDHHRDHNSGHDHYPPQHLQQGQRHEQRDVGGEDSVHKEDHQQLQRRKRKQRQQQHQQPAEGQRGDLYDTRSKKISKESQVDHAALLTVITLPASANRATGPPGAAPGFGARDRVTDDESTAAGGGSTSASTAADNRGFGGGGGGGGGGTAEAEDADMYGNIVTGGGSEAMRQAREALARYRGGGIPRIIHQMYGLFDTTPSPGRRDRLIGPSLNPDPNPDQATVTAAPRRKVLQQQQTQQQQQQQWPQGHKQRVRSLQGWSGGPEVSMQSWRRLNPGYTHILWGPGDVDELVEVMFPAFAPAFRSFRRMPVLRADLARYLVVFAFGGVYADTDTLCLRAVDGWADGLAPNVSAIVGVEADAGAIAHWERFWGRQLQFCQWTFAAEPAHPLLAHVVFRISQLLEQRPADQLVLDDVIHVTGPSVMSDAVYDYLKSKGRDWHEFEGLTHGTLVGDLLVLPITAFSPGVGHMGAGPVGHPEARVQHLFGGSWRTQGFATHGSGNN